MANLTATGRSKHATLAAGAEDVVTLDKGYPIIEVENRASSGDLWFTVNSGMSTDVVVTATVAGDGMYHVPPGGVRLVPDDTGSRTPPASVVHLISATATAYSITGLEDS